MFFCDVQLFEHETKLITLNHLISFDNVENTIIISIIVFEQSKFY